MGICAEPTSRDTLPTALIELCDSRPRAANLVVVSTRPFDPDDETRFAALHARPDVHHRLQRSLRFWPGSTAWNETFREATS